MDCQGWELHRIDETASHAILVVPYLRLDFLPTKSHYTQPICADSDLH